MNRAVVNTDTGEMLYELEAGDRIVKSKSIDKLTNTERFGVKVFCKTNNEELELLLPELSTAEKGLIFSLIPFIRYESGLIAYSNGRDIGFNDMVKLSGVSVSSARRAIDSLIEKDILYKGKNSKNVQFYMNPWILARGNTICKTLRDMFKNYRIRSRNNIRWKDLK